MKRTSEHQITKEDVSKDDLEEEVEETPTFKKADESVLATRTIRAMPKRSLAGTFSPPNGIPAAEASSPKFGGFAGFTAPTSKSDSITLTPPAPFHSPASDKQLPPSALNSGSNPPPSSPSHFPSGVPPVAPSASDATKTFASFLSSPAVSSIPQPQPSSSHADEGPDAAALEYYSSLRGLNVSFLSAISTAVEQDPFLDVSNLLERYRNLRIDVQKEFDQKSSPQTNELVTGRSIPAALPIPSTSTATTTTSVLPPKSAFTFFSVPTAAPTAFTGTSSLEPDSGNKNTSTLFSGSSANSSTTSLFGTSLPPTKGSPFSVFGSSSFTEKDQVNETKTSINLSGTSGLFGTTEKPSPPNLFGSVFGSGAANAQSPFGSFGKASGSIGNPIGFGFGMPSKAPAAEEPSQSKAAAFSFGVHPSPKDSETTTPEEGEVDGNLTPTESGEGDAAKLNPIKIHDVEGEGEEDEHTTHSVRTKVYKLTKNTGESSWVEMGVGILRLKKHKEKGARRMLLRNSSTGKITINFNIYAELNPTQTTKFVSFVGHEDGSPIMFKLRLKSEEDAVELKKAMDREITLVKTTSE